MKKRDPDLLLYHAPLLRQGMTTPIAMRDVVFALMPATAASMWFFGISAVLVLASCIAGAVLAPLLSPFDKDKIDLTKQYLPPSLDHPFGTDDLGRDVFARMLQGAWVSLTVGFVAVGISVLIGIFMGGIAGYFGERHIRIDHLIATGLARSAGLELSKPSSSGCI